MFVGNYRVGPIDSTIAIVFFFTDDTAHHRQAVYKFRWQQRYMSGTSKINMIVGRHSLRDSKTSQVDLHLFLEKIVWHLQHETYMPF